MAPPDLMFGVNFKQARTMFFDRPAVRNKIDAGTRKTLSRFGAFIRVAAIRSIRNSKRTSKPGKPPYSHTGLLKRFIYFGYDTTQRSVVIGPVSLSRKSGKAPQVLEYGGKVTLPDGREVKIKPRPYMGPAFHTNLKVVSSLWRDAIR
jgi:hypothetical protein